MILSNIRKFGFSELRISSFGARSVGPPRFGVPRWSHSNSRQPYHPARCVPQRQDLDMSLAGPPAIDGRTLMAPNLTVLAPKRAPLNEFSGTPAYEKDAPLNEFG